MKKFEIFKLPRTEGDQSSHGYFAEEQREHDEGWGQPDSYEVVESEISEQEDPQWIKMRNIRNALLRDCDWTQFNDSPLSSENKSAWSEYRQALRDLPENTEDPTNAEWPSKP